MRLDRLILEVVPGLERVLCDELAEEFGLRGEALLPGRVAVGLREPLGRVVRALNRRARCPERVGVLLLDASGVGSLAEIREIAAALEYQELWGSSSAFAVRASREGGQSFRSPEIARTVGSAINDALTKARGAAGRVDLEDPDVVIRADLRGERLLLWLDTTGYDTLHRRSYRVYTHMASMRPTVANLLLGLAGWRGETLIDPFCGSATIPIEAALRARGRPPGRLRGEGWIWQRLPRLREGERNDDDAGSGRAAEGGIILGVERFASHLQGGLENAARAGVQDGIILYEGRAQELEAITAELGIDAAGATVVTNPPFGRRVGSTGMLADLYREAARAWARIGVATVVTIAERQAPMQRALEEAGYHLEDALPVTYGSTPVTVFLAVSPR